MWKIHAHVAYCFCMEIDPRVRAYVKWLTVTLNNVCCELKAHPLNGLHLFMFRFRVVGNKYPENSSQLVTSPSHIKGI